MIHHVIELIEDTQQQTDRQQTSTKSVVNGKCLGKKFA